MAVAPPTHRKTSGLAVWSLICGLGGLVSGLLAGLPAIIMGHIALGKIGRSGGALGGKGLALTGVILGYLSIPLTVVIVILVGMVSGGFNETGREIKTKSKLQVINASLTAYRIRANHFPSELQGLKALVERPTTAPELGAEFHDAPEGWLGPGVRLQVSRIEGPEPAGSDLERKGRRTRHF